MKSLLSSGLFQASGAYFIWGIVPLYWIWLTAVPATEIIAHRICWSFVILGVIIVARKRTSWVIRGLKEPKSLLLLTITALLISVNWLLYVWAVNNGYVIEASLGYYINPLINILLGALFLGERLRRLQYVAIFLAFLGVMVLTLNYGRLPWIALTLAGSFGTYALLRKFVTLDAQTALFIETGIVLIPAFLYLVLGHHSHALTNASTITILLLIGGGAITIIPLVLIANGLKTLTLATIGLLQYISPTLQFLCGVLIFKEPFSTIQLISFVLIWTGLGFYTLEVLHFYQKDRQKRAPKR